MPPLRSNAAAANRKSRRENEDPRSTGTPPHQASPSKRPPRRGVAAANAAADPPRLADGAPAVDAIRNVHGTSGDPHPEAPPLLLLQGGGVGDDVLVNGDDTEQGSAIRGNVAPAAAATTGGTGHGVDIMMPVVSGGTGNGDGNAPAAAAGPNNSGDEVVPPADGDHNEDGAAGDGFPFLVQNHLQAGGGMGGFEIGVCYARAAAQGTITSLRIENVRLRHALRDMIEPRFHNQDADGLVQGWYAIRRRFEMSDALRPDGLMEATDGGFPLRLQDHVREGGAIDGFGIGASYAREAAQATIASLRNENERLRGALLAMTESPTNGVH